MLAIDGVAGTTRRFLSPWTTAKRSLARTARADYWSSTSSRNGPPTELTVNDSETTASLIARIVFA